MMVIFRDESLSSDLRGKSIRFSWRKKWYSTTSSVTNCHESSSWIDRKRERTVFFVGGGSLLTFAGCEGAYQSRHQHAEQQEQGTRFRPHRVGVTVVRRSFVHFTPLNRGVKETATLFTMKFSVVENRTCNEKIKIFLKINHNKN